MNKKTMLIPLVLVLALVLCVFTGCGCQKRPQQTDPRATTGTDSTADPTIDTTGVITATQNAVDATSPAYSEIVGGGDERREESAQPSVNQTQPTEKNNTTSTTSPAQPSGSTDSDGTVSYADYLKMTTSEQQAYFRSFEDPDLFYEWLEDAEAKHKAENPDNVIAGDGTLDMGAIMDKINGEK